MVGLWTRGTDEGLSPFSSDSGVGEVDGVELSPDSLVFNYNTTKRFVIKNNRFVFYLIINKED